MKNKKYRIKYLPVYDDRCINTKLRTNDDNVYANFCSINVPEDDMECESYTVFSICSLLVYEKK